MRQLTPQSWGRVYWSGGAGKPGEMGGWRFHCNWCTEGSLHTAFARKHTADAYLSNHCMEKHRHKTEVRALMSTGDPVEAKITTGAAELDGLIDGRSVSGVKLTRRADLSLFSKPQKHFTSERDYPLHIYDEEKNNGTSGL